MSLKNSSISILPIFHGTLTRKKIKNFYFSSDKQENILGTFRSPSQHKQKER